MSRGEAGGTLPLEQLVALNDEIAALVRAGVPLDRGLEAMGGEMPGRTGEVATRIGARLRTGETLQQILAQEGTMFPPLWRAVVEAGLRSGRLAAALEGLSATGRNLAELRRATRYALIYPLVVLVLAFGLFVLTTTHFAPILFTAMEDMTRTSDPLFTGLVWLGERAKWWGTITPVVAVIGLGTWWRRSGGAMWSTGHRRRSRWLNWWPSFSQALRDGQMATFAEIFALLVRQQVPLAESVVLAADACGDRALGNAARSAAARLRDGGSLSVEDARALQFPPLFAWLLSAGVQYEELATQLTAIAKRYRQRALDAAQTTLVYLPIVLSVVIGGTATLMQGVLLFTMLRRMLLGLNS